ncbi:MAG: hypothetical protein K6E10_02265 [Eubacterium sp.]|nr:hypothetical protein [Eubacterium sp.]
MINDAMMAVDAAEKEVASKIAAAKETAEKLRKSSLAECEEISKNAELSVKQNEEQAMISLAAERDQRSEEASKNAEIKAQNLRQDSLAKESQAIEAVIKSLTSV